jgi:hypothetical protein
MKLYQHLQKFVLLFWTPQRSLATKGNPSPIVDNSQGGESLVNANSISALARTNLSKQLWLDKVFALHAKERPGKRIPVKTGNETTDLFIILCKKRYKNIRYASELYSDTEKEVPVLLRAKTVNGGVKSSYDDFVFRMSDKMTTYLSQRADENNIIKYSMNVEIRADLIRALDNFLIKYPERIEYKIDVQSYPLRHDSVNLYCANPLSKEEEQILATGIQPFIRGDSLIGESIAQENGDPFLGIRKEVQPTIAETREFIDKCELLSKDFADGVISIAESPEFPLLSRAYLSACEGLYEDLKRLKEETT